MSLSSKEENNWKDIDRVKAKKKMLISKQEWTEDQNCREGKNGGSGTINEDLQKVMTHFILLQYYLPREEDSHMIN